MNKKNISIYGDTTKFPKSIIAEEFKNDNIFVLYNSEKIPYSAITNSKVNIKEKRYLSCYKKALFSLKNAPKFNGIGIVLGNTSKGNLCCLDIDKCINNEGVLSDFAQEIISLLDTYTEISQSGKGIHCLFYANKLGDACKISGLDGCEGFELYDKNRYIALTENCINNKSIEYRQKQCDLIYKKFFEKISAQKDEINFSIKIDSIDKKEIDKYLNIIYKSMDYDSKLKNYWHRLNIGKNESENDYAFIGKLAYYTNYNPNLVQNLAFLSPFFKNKDNIHKYKWLNRKDYLERTIFSVLRKRGLKNE